MAILCWTDDNCTCRAAQRRHRAALPLIESGLNLCRQMEVRSTSTDSLKEFYISTRIFEGKQRRVRKCKNMNLVMGSKKLTYPRISKYESRVNSIDGIMRLNVLLSQTIWIHSSQVFIENPTVSVSREETGRVTKLICNEKWCSASIEWKKKEKTPKNKLCSTRKRTKRDFYSFKSKKEKNGILIVGIVLKRKWFADENNDFNGANN